MLEDLPWDGIKDIGAGGIVVAIIWMILTGRLVPRFFYQQKVDECETWKKSALTSAEQTGQLLEYAKTADAILKALPRGGVHSEVD